MILATAALLAVGKDAAALTADDVLNKMTGDERFAYVSGLVDGLAYARWLSDKPDETGMQCIHNWYYQGGEERSNLVHQWFSRHLNKPADALLYVFIKRECVE